MARHVQQRHVEELGIGGAHFPDAQRHGHFGALVERMQQDRQSRVARLPVAAVNELRHEHLARLGRPAIHERRGMGSPLGPGSHGRAVGKQVDTEAQRVLGTVGPEGVRFAALPSRGHPPPGNNSRRAAGQRDPLQPGGLAVITRLANTAAHSHAIEIVVRVVQWMVDAQPLDRQLGEDAPQLPACRVVERL